MTSNLNKFKIVLNYDISCPRSWVFYQVLQQKLPKWRAVRDFEIDYRPVNHVVIHRCIYNTFPSGTVTAKRDYLLKELYEICDFYGIEKTDFDWKPIKNRSLSSLWILNAFRRKLPQYYEPFLREMWREYWHGSGIVNQTTHFLKIGRKLGIPFSVMDNHVMHVEDRENYKDVCDNIRYLLEIERIIGCPWFRVNTEDGRKILGFSEILRLEWMDEWVFDLEDPNNPLNSPEEFTKLYFHKDDNSAIEEEDKEVEKAVEEAKHKSRKIRRGLGD